jgi:hypothetical protein
MNMQVKIFDFSSLGYESENIEENINSWLTANPSVKVIHVKIKVLPGTGGESLFIFIFYEGPLGKSVFAAEL